MTAVIGVPYGTLMLADMGAEVIRLESTKFWVSTTRGYLARPDPSVVPSMGPVARGYPDLDPGKRPWNRFALFNCHAVNKRSMTVDLGQPEGREIVHDLARVSDLFIENMPGVTEKLGIDYPSLRRVRPDIIVVSASGMGATGPYKDLRGFGSTIEDVMGHPWLRGYVEDHPQAVTNSVASDPAAGTAVVWAAIAALHHRDRTGRGQYIDLAMAELFVHHLGSSFWDYALNGRVQRTTGNRHQYIAPHNCYRAKGEEQWVNIAVWTDEQWLALRKVMGDPAWARDPRFADGYRRFRNQDELDRHIAAWVAERSAHEAQETLQRAGVAAGAILSVADIYRDPHLRQRGLYQRITHPEAGTHDYPVSLWRMSETQFEVRHAPPLLGEDNPYAYRDLLGYSASEYRRLEQVGHIGMDYAPNIQ
jgi:benzylsuccinate CoA-transferase BbsF subunit